MDFFQAQAQARVRSGRLVIWFILAVVAIVLSIYAVVSTAMVNLQGQRQSTRLEMTEKPLLWWDLQRFGLVAGAVVLVVGGASLFKMAELSQGGGAVARSVGGRKLDPTTRKTDERRLLNVVEEMAIASGAPMPEVYLLDNEEGINAFAAGHSMNDAAVAVTRGCLEKLTRDELQGVIAHEFSHILNGDMKLNLRIAGTIFGILVLGIIGRIILEVMGRGGRGRSRDSDGKGGGAVVLIFIVGIALLVIGYLGTFFGRLIQAAVSRQREFLADASAVQFTRNPAGIGGALKRILANATGSHVESGAASGYAHFFFANAMTSGLTSMLATHPPLEVRIRAVEPSWDGKLPKDVGFSANPNRNNIEGASAFAGGQPPLLPRQKQPQKIAISADNLLGSAGALNEGNANYARQMLGAIPGAIRDAAADPFQAQALIIGLLVHDDPARRAVVLAYVRENAPRQVGHSLGFLLPAVLGRPAWERLPMIELCLPALKDLPRPEKEAFFELLVYVAAADQKTSLFEFALLEIVKRRFGFNQPRAGHPVQPAYSRLLSAVALVSASEPDPARNLLNTVAGDFAKLGAVPNFILYSNQDFNALSEALEILVELSLETRQVILRGVANIIANDGQITIEEAEIYRAIAICLDVPVPPIQPSVPVN
ncbi:MAG: M48 family metallopeptidase [Verrucomicrobiota bacterium]|nr:M48 family metallopeptidase [Verrucomicrobiota bacterium]